MNNKLKWLLCLGLVGLVTGSALVTWRFRSHPSRLATPNSKPHTANSPLSLRRTTLAPFSTAVSSPAQTRTESLSRFEQAQLVESQEAFDVAASQRIVLEILKIDA